MSTARLLIASLVLAGLGGAIWWSNKQEAAKEGQPDPKAAPKILTLTEADITRMELEHRGEPATVVVKDDGGKWSITAPSALPADQPSIHSVATGIANLTSDHIVDENAKDLAGYGLEPPLLAVQVTMKDGKVHRLRIGDETPDKSGTYASVDGSARLYSMSPFSKAVFDKRARDLREKHLLGFAADKLTRVELNVAGKPPLEFGRSGESLWQMLKPRPLRADASQVEELVRLLHDAEMDVAIDDKDAATGFNSGKPVATAKVTGAEGVLTLEVRQAGMNYFAKSSTVPGLFKVNSDVGKGVTKTLEDFENKKLFDFAFDEVSKVEYKSKSELKPFEKNGTDWISNGRTMDSVSVQNLIDKLRDLSATSLDTAAMKMPEIEISVVSKAGVRTEKVSIAPQRDDFLARREGEPSVYRISGSTIGGLRDAAAGVQEAAPPAAAGKGKAAEKAKAK
ncbi:MAG: DUF4340 domain-containing protein [Acidobacteriota bacterium]